MDHLKREGGKEREREAGVGRTREGTWRSRMRGHVETQEEGAWRCRMRGSVRTRMRRHGGTQDEGGREDEDEEAWGEAG